MLKLSHQADILSPKLVKQGIMPQMEKNLTKNILNRLKILMLLLKLMVKIII